MPEVQVPADKSPPEPYAGALTGWNITGTEEAPVPAAAKSDGPDLLLNPKRLVASLRA
ncbi:MAG: hypothetical protein M0Z41_10835 [Peptococcaceae bacterium]|nr:hypothetical protein [Peptococcaceae bacterium]